jgi:hypothetical protein
LISDSHTENGCQIRCALPAIIQLIKTAPSVQRVILSVDFTVTEIALADQLDWSPLTHLESFSPSIHIDLYVKGVEMYWPESDESIFPTFDVLIDLVKRDMVTLKSGSTDYAI